MVYNLWSEEKRIYPMNGSLWYGIKIKTPIPHSAAKIEIN